MNRLVTCAVLAALAGCAQDDPTPDPGPRAVLLDRPTVRALRDYVYAGYALRRLRDDPGAGGSVTGLEAELEASRVDLRDALVAAGADPNALADDGALLDQVGEAVRGGGRYGIVFTPQRESFALVRIRSQERDRSVLLFDDPFRYDLLVHDETLVSDYPQWLALQVAPAAAIRQPATYSSEGTVRLDLQAIEQIGQRGFLPRVEALRATRDALRDDRWAAERASPERLGELLAGVKDALRWRSLEPLWTSVQARQPSEQLARFVEDYAARAELRAAAELRELIALRSPGDERPLDAADSRWIYTQGALSAIAHGDPLGHTADVVALAAAGLQADAPALVAARQLVGELAAAFRQAGVPASEAGDAAALAALARAEPQRLQALARELHALHQAETPR